MNFNPWSQYSAPAIQPQTSPTPYSIQSGFVSVQSEQEARMYPVALGNSITFIDECAPYMYVKTMGRSRFDPPTFERIKLVREEAADAPKSTETAFNASGVDLSVFVLKSEFEPFQQRIEALQNEVAMIKDKPKRKILKEVEVDDE